ncbi:Formate hydrogenlyase subunit 3/Multisubunit Na+/H+ antiporter, MnhD subunit [Dehalogenimonas formicexedens]|uniref:Formate hydrogenlyase subunit 3/Multisubunit Na+/H+ antiporter, MnhD subunit n=2 Tax=Dehalogenimonas formicexedens TaxID=1839801 RepID=A0A1P8F9P4_9CHLR|nr:Formate hydrogenlyase subunit 3/Multisubunit Na+/H+ antiporter, MnhD subunit [Dehalogenimonas formicexedens]
MVLAALTSVTGSRERGSGRRFALGLVMAGALAWIAASIVILADDSDLTFRIYSLTPQLGIAFHLDRLAAFFILIVSSVAACVAIYSLKYIEHTGSQARRDMSVAAMSVFILSMVLVVASANFFGFIFFWELMSLSSLFLVMFDREKAETVKAGIYYLVMTQFSTLFLLLGALLLHRYTGSFDIASAGGLTLSTAGIIFIAFFIGFGTKAGIIPFHKWLPFAHAAAPSNISALMSGVMIKVAIYGLIRVLLDVLSPDLWWGTLLLVFGTVSAVLGVIYALKEHDLKKLLAFHSIENIGIIVIGLGLWVIFSHYSLNTLADLSLFGALFHTLNHAIFKSLLFMTAGSVVAATHTRNIEEMGGLVKTMPVTAAIFLIGSAAISALPPLNGFASEVMLFQAYLGAFQVPSPLTAVLLFTALAGFALMSALAAACFVKAFGAVFLALPRSREAEHAREAPRAMLVGPGILAAACIILGVFSYQILRAIGLDLPLPNVLPVSLIAAAVFWLAVLALRRSEAKARVSETWGCGIHTQTSKMEYTASGFSEPIITIFSPIFRTRKTGKREFFDKDKAIVSGGSGEVHTLQFFEERIYLPTALFVKRIASFISRLHNVDLDANVMYVFAVVVVILLAVGQLL